MPDKLPTNVPIILIDSREQRPYPFEYSETCALPTGDYSVAGLQHGLIAIERKSLADAYSSLGADRSRFQREIERLAGFDYGAILIESSYSRFKKGYKHSRMHPVSAVATLDAWSIRYGVHILYRDTRELAQETVKNLLTKYWKEYVNALKGEVE